MSDVKHFDAQQALERATDLFWRRGYAATSMADLVAETGVARSSLYATFGDKDALYAAALTHYCATQAAPRHALLDGEGPVLHRVRTLLEGVAAASAAHPDRRGCLVVNAATERVPADPTTAAAVAAQLERFEDALTTSLTRGQAAGEVVSDRPPRALARFLVTFVQGMRVVDKGGRDDPAVLRDALEVALRAISPP